jgi:hypothetical protein
MLGLKLEDLLCDTARDRAAGDVGATARQSILARRVDLSTQRRHADAG